MLKKKLILIMFILLTIGTASVGANSLLGEFEGYTKVKIKVNQDEKEFKHTEVPGFIIKGATVIPLRTIADALQTFVIWDNNTKTVDMIKPNVHMFVASEIAKDYSLKTPFGVVKKGNTIDFVVFPQIDNLKISIASMRLRIVSPSGKIILPVNKDGEKIEIVSMLGHKENFWYPFKFEGVTFEEAGDYIIKLEMKLSTEGEFRLISTKKIISE